MLELEVLRDAIVSGSEVFRSPDEVRKKRTATGVYDIVTDSDIGCEQRITGMISGAFPDDVIISEESNPDAEPGRRTWVIDPLDGTMNMSRGMPLYGMQGAFLEDGFPKAAVIYLPRFDQLYTASGNGAFMNGSPIRTAGPRPLKECILTTGDFSRRSEEYRLMQARLLSGCRDTVARFKMLGAACMDFAMLASGMTDIHVRFVNRMWDYIPGMFIAEKAGAVYDEELLKKTGILMMCSCDEVLDSAMEEVLPSILDNECGH